jgi:hypothetical protein
MGNRSMERNERRIGKLNASLRVILELDLCEIPQTRRDTTEPVYRIFVQDILSSASVSAIRTVGCRHHLYHVSHMPAKCIQLKEKLLLR